MKVYQCPSTPDYPRMVAIGLTIEGESPDFVLPQTGARDYFGPLMVRYWDSAAGRNVHRPTAWYGGQDPIDEILSNNEGFASYKPTKLSHITDGLSRTILFSEQAGAPTRYSGYKAANDDVDHSPRVARSDLGWCGSLSAGWTTGFDNSTVRFFNGPDDSQGMALNWDNCWGLYSFHVGVNATLCDGSVRFLEEGIEREILISLLTRSEAD